MNELGLHGVDGSTMCNYPTPGGKGGVGFTFFQPITESFLTWDMWPKLKGGYLIVCSCKLFWVSAVIKILKENGLEVVNVKSEGLGLG